MKNNIEFNNSLIQKIDNIEKKSGEFDEIFKSLINISNFNNLTPEQIEKLYLLTSIFKSIRADHGAILLLLEMKKDLIKSNKETNQSNLEEDLYDLSTFTSIISNVSELISNIDFEFKRIAIMFPKFMNKNQTTLILLTDKNDKDNKYIKIMDEIKQINPENNYKVFKCQVGEKINCGKVDTKELKLTVKKVPSMFLVTNSNITELPVESINDVETLANFLD